MLAIGRLSLVLGLALFVVPGAATIGAAQSRARACTGQHARGHHSIRVSLGAGSLSLAGSLDLDPWPGRIRLASRGLEPRPLGRESLAAVLGDPWDAIRTLLSSYRPSLRWGMLTLSVDGLTWAFL